MNLGLLLIIILLVVLFAGIPTWPYSANWGYGPSGVIGTILLVVLILFLFGKL